jgi:Zn-dependent M28 family amino/carboxypeptidase
VHNVEVAFSATEPGASVVVVGAHYDSAIGTPGANDNGSGVAALLALAHLFAGTSSPREFRLVWFTNEEPPYFQTNDMGSLLYARHLAAERRVVSAMLSLETMGFYVQGSDSQDYPGPLRGFFPDEGNFLAFVGNDQSVALVREAIGAFRQHAAFPSEGVAFSGAVQGIGWSDHWSFWQIGVPALMITDTAPFRYRHYHQPTDTPDRIDFLRLARVTLGVADVVRALLRHEP